MTDPNKNTGGVSRSDTPDQLASEQAPALASAAPPPPHSGWGWAWFVVKAVEIRLRFILILLAICLFFVYRDTIRNYWDKWTRPPASGVEARSDEEFYCPMHPSVVRPGLDPNGAVPKCPICGMPLSKRKKGEAAPLPPNVLARVQLTPERIYFAGIETAEVTYQPLVKEITTVGHVIYDESRLSQIVTRVDGYLEKLHVDKTWITVTEGDPLAEIYSPELYSTARELLLALDRKGTEDLAKSSRERLRLLGVGEREIDEIVQSKRANHRLVIRAPQSGHVIRKEVKQGAHVEAGQTLFEIADLSAVWIEAEVYEKDIPFLGVGQAIAATVEASPNRPFTGRVSLVHPHLETATRTNAVRFEIENPRHELRPGMFATVRIQTPLADIEPFKTLLADSADGSESTEMKDDGEATKREAGVLAVPELAVIDTGSKKIVYVERQPGLFDGVEVEVGPRAGNFYAVMKGLQAGDRVVAAGSFLIDAENRLNPGAASTYFGARGSPHAGHTGPAAPTRRTGPSPANGASKAAPKKPSPDDLKNIDKLAGPDRKLALAQRLCPNSGEPLGSMGVPHKMTIKGQTIFLCCKGCDAEVNKEPEKFLKKVAELKAATSTERNGR